LQNNLKIMLQNISPEITIAAFGIIGTLTAYVWNSQEKRLVKLERDVEICPFPSIKEDVAAIKKDVDWLKKFLIKN